tara:strand:- start:303 stop:737 length:435 start_codon:yes stop_codon:yes gene_type:complete
MKKILISTGTTEFDRLINHAVEIFDASKFAMTIQTPKKIYHAEIKSFVYIDNIKEKYKSYDLIITHAGAGNCYQLLEMNCAIIVVPNLERRDKHQKDLGLYLQTKNYCAVCWDLNDLESLIIDYEKKSFSNYSKEKFFRPDLIN